MTERTNAIIENTEGVTSETATNDVFLLIRKDPPFHFANPARSRGRLRDNAGTEACATHHSTTIIFLPTRSPPDTISTKYIPARNPALCAVTVYVPGD